MSNGPNLGPFGVSISPFRFSIPSLGFFIPTFFGGLKEGFRELSFSSPQMDPSSLNSAELQRFLTQEKEKAMLNEMVGKLTGVCWDKCISGTPGGKFSSSESACLSNCAQRYMDVTLLIVKRVQSMQ
ncbi:hypothetical protein REPUB_Repub07fG0020100 [Reevesia pubescens]